MRGFIEKLEIPKDEALVTLWVQDRYPSIVRNLERGLREAGFNTQTKANEADISTHVMVNGQCRGIIDVMKVMLDIATTDDLQYDNRLSDSLYEANKIRRAIGDRIEAAKVLFNASIDGGESVDKLQKLSKDHNIRFVLVRRDE